MPSFLRCSNNNNIILQEGVRHVRLFVSGEWGVTENRSTTKQNHGTSFILLGANNQQPMTTNNQWHARLLRLLAASADARLCLYFSKSTAAVGACSENIAFNRTRIGRLLWSEERPRQSSPAGNTADRAGSPLLVQQGYKKWQLKVYKRGSPAQPFYVLDRKKKFAGSSSVDRFSRTRNGRNS